jgi:hypothetical protein
MPTPTVITDLSTTAASNFPAGSDAPSTIDDTLRAHGAFIRENYNRLTDGTDAITCAQLTATGALVNGSGGLGFSAGSGGTVTQATSKGTGVTLNKSVGQVVTHNASLGAGSRVAFVLTNSTIAATDVVVVSLTGTSSANYSAYVTDATAGTAKIALHNTHTGDLAEAVTINFAVIKGVTS